VRWTEYALARVAAQEARLINAGEQLKEPRRSAARAAILGTLTHPEIEQARIEVPALIQALTDALAADELQRYRL